MLPFKTLIVIEENSPVAIYRQIANGLCAFDPAGCDPAGNFSAQQQRTGNADAVFKQLGANLVRISVDEDGMDIDAIAEVLEKTKISLLYIIPHHHHPTTVTLSVPRRIQLLQLIRQYQLPVIEDDYDYDFHYQNSPVLPLASSDHDGNVLYIGSFTKMLAPSFRIGYLIAPSNFITQATNMKRLIDLRGDTIMEERWQRLSAAAILTATLKDPIRSIVNAAT